MKYEIKCPYCGNNQVYKPRKEPPKVPHTKCKECKKEFNFEVNNPKKIIIEKVSKKDQGHFIPPENNDTQMTTGDIVQSVNDPVGFVTGIITEELMKTRDVRWATLFVSVLRESKKLDYNTQQEKEWSNQAKALTIEDLVEKVAIKGSISRNISRRLEKKDDTSPLDNLLDV